ncbi:MAG: heat-inducible transcription repressor HrcA [Clostridia bacterium]|nr:heat-inducible transcription repressor HrcA [Clostridia bacterium]
MDRYVSSGEPVGSKAVCEDLDFSFSSATIRSEMAGLASLGYLFQPHVSSGRIPSHQGYRLYINKLMEKKPLTLEEKSFLTGELNLSSAEPEKLLEAAAKALSEITSFTAIVTTPPSAQSCVRDITFVGIGRRTAMLVLMTSDGIVKNKIFRCEYDLTSEVLHMFSGILNGKFRGEKLKDITPEFINILVSKDRELAMLLLPVIDVLMEAARETCEVKIKVYGQKNLLSIPGITPGTVINIFDFLEDKNKVFDLLDTGSYGTKFTIGEENKYLQLQEASVVSTHYSIGGKFGAIGVIGPTRMDYGKIYSQIEYVASLVGVLLGRILENN